MPHIVKYKVTSLLDAEKVYSSTDDFWQDHMEYLDSARAKRYELMDGKVLSTSEKLAEDGLSVTTTREFVDESSYNEYIIATDAFTPSITSTLKFEKTSI